MKRLLPIFVLTLLFVPGCKEKPNEIRATEVADKTVQNHQPAPLTYSLLSQPIEPMVVERPTEALPIWRAVRGGQPVLVLLSQDPLLARIPAQLRDEAMASLNSGSGQHSSSAPLLLPSMALSAALESGFFTRVVWILPTKGAINELSVETFRTQLRDLGAVDDREAASFIHTAAGVFSGTVRGMPFQAVHPDALPVIKEPVVLHIDLSYFQPLYKGEIKSPLYPLLAQALDRLRQKDYQTVAVSISLSNLDGQVPLASRFVGKELATFFRDPTVFDQPLSESWDLRTRALYLENFFKKEEVRELYLKMEQKNPNDPSIKYALYQVARQFKEGDKALDYLSQAIKLDRVYALEYLALADLANEQQLPDQALRMLILASNAFPDNPILKIPLAERLLASGQREHALKILQELQKLPWSEVYYSNIPEHLRKLQQQ